MPMRNPRLKSGLIAPVTSVVLFLSSDRGIEASLEESLCCLDDLRSLSLRQHQRRHHRDTNNCECDFLDCAHSLPFCQFMNFVATFPFAPPITKILVTSASHASPTASVVETCSNPPSSSAVTPVMTTTGRASGQGFPSIT